MIHVIAVIETAEGAREDYIREFHKVMPFVRAALSTALLSTWRPVLRRRCAIMS